MTRGNFLLITNTANWMSIQFNGDMYPSCNGKFVYHMLESVKNYNDLTAAILKFDKERFGYSYEYGEDMTPKSISDNIDSIIQIIFTLKTHPIKTVPLSPRTKWSRLSSREKFRYGILDALSSLTLKTLSLMTMKASSSMETSLQKLHLMTDCRRFSMSAIPSWKTCQKALPTMKKKSCRRS